MKNAVLIGRILYSVPFIVFGLNHILNFGEMSQYTASMGVPVPTVATIITGLILLAGGFSILLGYKVKIGAILLIIFLIPVTFIAHNFWALEDAGQSQMQLVMFLKNSGLLGGAFLILYFGSGPLSIEKQPEK